jgi:hypothetical protein
MNELHDNNNENVIKDLMIEKHNEPLEVEFDNNFNNYVKIKIYPKFNIVKNYNNYDFFISFEEDIKKYSMDSLLNIDITSTYNKLYKSKKIKMDIDSINKITRMLKTISNYVKGNIDDKFLDNLYKCNTFEEIVYRYQHTKWSR